MNHHVNAIAENMTLEMLAKQYMMA